MNRFQWFRKAIGGYWELTYLNGWIRIPQFEYDTMIANKTKDKSGLEDWT